MKITDDAQLLLKESLQAKSAYALNVQLENSCW